MLLNFLDKNRYLEVNKDVIKLFDLNTAVMLSEIIRITSTKPLDEDGFVIISRKEITENTSLTTANQVLAEDRLVTAEIIEKRVVTGHTRIKFNCENYIGLIACVDTDEFENIKKSIKIKVCNLTEQKKLSRSDALNQALIESIRYDEKEIVDALSKWITVIQSRFAYKGRAWLFNTLNSFEDGLETYTNELDIALKLIDIATSKCYSEIQWVIEIYERNNKTYHTSSNSGVRVTEQKIATTDSINTNNIF